MDEQARLFEMTRYERRLCEEGYKLIAGTDEVGRGALAGPVAACVLILPEGFTYPGINDSKKVSKKKRKTLSEIIRENAVAYDCATVSAFEIDEINILNATRLAMVRAFNRLETKPDFLLADAIKLNEIDIPQEAITGGDAKSVTIAAASIVAKVYRDKIMDALHERFPVYGFNTNKGYGTKKHIEAIKQHGICPVHRRSFARWLYEWEGFSKVFLAPC